MSVRLILVALTWFMCGCKDQIIHNLNETQVNRLISKLSEHQISAEKEKQPDGKWALTVDGSESVLAVRLLTEQHLLKDQNATHTEKSSIISSREEQRFQFERDLSHSIEETLENVPNVLEARVHLNLPPTDPLFGRPLNNQAGSGSVVLVVASLSLDASEIASIVSGASGVPREFITVSVKQIESVRSKTLSFKEPDTHWLNYYKLPLSVFAFLLVLIGISTPVILMRKQREV